jgi:hypothetical protein
MFARKIYEDVGVGCVIALSINLLRCGKLSTRQISSRGYCLDQLCYNRNSPDGAIV